MELKEKLRTIVQDGLAARIEVAPRVKAIVGLVEAGYISKGEHKLVIHKVVEKLKASGISKKKHYEIVSEIISVIDSYIGGGEYKVDMPDWGTVRGLSQDLNQVWQKLTDELRQKYLNGIPEANSIPKDRVIALLSPSENELGYLEISNHVPYSRWLELLGES